MTEKRVAVRDVDRFMEELERCRDAEYALRKYVKIKEADGTVRPLTEEEITNAIKAYDQRTQTTVPDEVRRREPDKDRAHEQELHARDRS